MVPFIEGLGEVNLPLVLKDREVIIRGGGGIAFHHAAELLLETN